MRDIFGPICFRPLFINKECLTATTVALAGGIYADQAFDRLPILADALEDAGCDDPEILTHCRQEGRHVKGCWVIDLILGRS